MATTISEADILYRVVEPENGDLSAQAAEALAALSFRADQISRMDELAAKNRDGVISDEEREEMEKYSRVGHFLNLMQSKARQTLAHR